VKPKKSKSTDLALPKTKALAPTDAPAYVKQGNRGKENIDRTDFVIPRIKLCQALTPEVVAGKAKAGDMLNSLSGEHYGTSLEFIPLLHFKSRMFWQDREDGNAVLCSSDDAKSPKDINAAPKIAKKLKILKFPATMELCTNCQFKNFDETEDSDKKKRPKCTMYYNFPVLIKGDNSPSALTMSRTKLKVGKTLCTLAVQGNVDMFAKRYKLSTKLEKGDKYSYYNFVVEPIGWASEEEYKLAEALNASFKNMNAVIDTEHPEE
jgi:hypothetical protein